jgi:hypothetical protein
MDNGLNLKKNLYHQRGALNTEEVERFLCESKRHLIFGQERYRCRVWSLKQIFFASIKKSGIQVLVL